MRERFQGYFPDPYASYHEEIDNYITHTYIWITHKYIQVGIYPTSYPDSYLYNTSLNGVFHMNMKFQSDVMKIIEGRAFKKFMLEAQHYNAVYPP